MTRVLLQIQSERNAAHNAVAKAIRTGALPPPATSAALSVETPTWRRNEPSGEPEMAAHPKREPVWTAEMVTRKDGDTTLQQCGWCEYARSGSARYDCMLSSQCTLDTYGADVEWDTPCRFKDYGASDLAYLVRYHIQSVESAERALARQRADLATLEAMDGDERPPLPEHRDSTHFGLNDRVRVWHDGKWCAGAVVWGYRHQDGCVSYILDDYPESGPTATSGGAWGSGMSGPWVMLETEWAYWREHPEQFDRYLSRCDRTYNDDRLPISDYRRALAEQAA